MTETDINRLIGIQIEQSEIECKVTQSLNSNFIDNKIIPTLVGFLNKLDHSGGIFFVGLDTGPNSSTISGVSPIQISASDIGKLQNKIKDLVGGLPREKVLLILIFRKFIFLMEIQFYW